MVEAFLLLQIGLVVGIVGITEAGKGNSKYTDVSVERLLLRICIFVSGTLFNALFWWKGLDVLVATPCAGVSKKGVGTYAFYGWKVSLYGWMRIVMQFQSLFVAVWTAPMHVSQDSFLLYSKIRTQATRSTFIDSVSVRNRTRQLEPRDEAQSLACKAVGAISISKNVGKSSVALSPSPGKDVNQPIEVSATSPKKASEDAKAVSKNVDLAERYLNSLFSMYVRSEVPMKSRRYCNGCCHITRPSHTRLKCVDKTSYWLCIWRCFLMTFDRQSLNLRWVLALHFTKAGQHNITHWPRVLNRIYEHGKDRPHWHHLFIASDLSLLQLPSTRSKTWMYDAAVQLIMFCLLVVQIELTIFWNHVTGLNALSPLGQLIPFVIGVGGLGRVLWCSFALKCTKKHTRETVKKSEYESALATYLDMKKAFEPHGRGGGVQRAFTA